MNTIFFIFTTLVRWTMTGAEYNRRCNRFDAGWGFRFLGLDCFTPSWFGQ